jgi:hypothetical protein
MNQAFSQMVDAIAEMNQVLSALRTPGNRYLSRTAIDTEVTESPEIYPRLAGMTRSLRLSFITGFMKERYQIWGSNTSNKKGSYVWIVEEKKNE